MKLSKKITLVMISMLVIVLAVGCSNDDKNSSEEIVSEGNESKNEEIIIEHELGEVKLKKDPKNIVVFDYGSLDTLDALGIDIVGLPKKSVPSYLDKYKDDKYEDLGTLFEPNFDKIFEIEPDLIIISGRQAELYEEFSKIAPTLYVTVDGSNYMSSFKENIDTLKEIFTIEDLANQKLAKIDEKIEALNKKVKEINKNGLFLMTNDGNMSVYGEGSRFGILYNEFGIKPADEKIEVSNHGQKVNFEYLKEVDPDYLYVMDRAVIAGGETYAKDMLENDIVKGTKAYKDGNIIYLTSEVWYVAAGGINATSIMVDDVLNSFN